MTIRLTKSLLADGWFKYEKGIAKKCVIRGLCIIKKAHLAGEDSAKFYLSTRQVRGGYARTYSKGEATSLADAIAIHDAPEKEVPGGLAPSLVESAIAA